MEIKASDLYKNCSIEVNMIAVKIFDTRIKLGIFIMKIAAKVAGVKIIINGGDL